MDGPTVDCIFWDNSDSFHHKTGSPFFRKRAHIPIEWIVNTVGKHLALGLYTLAQSFCATPSTFTITITSAGSWFPSEKLFLALNLAVNPAYIKEIDSTDLSFLLDAGLIQETSSGIVEAPFKVLHIPPEQLEQDEPRKVIGKKVSWPPPPHSISPTSTAGAHSSLIEPPTEPESNGLVLMNPESAAHPWRGALVGSANSLGRSSTLRGILIEFARQIRPDLGLYTIISAIATKNQVVLVVGKGNSYQEQASSVSPNDNSNEQRLDMAFQLLKSGGQPLDPEALRRAIQLNLLEETAGTT